LEALENSPTQAAAWLIDHWEGLMSYPYPNSAQTGSAVTIDKTVAVANL
jgi:hypothetical protein